MTTRGLEPTSRDGAKEDAASRDRASLPREGDVVGNRFRIEGVLGRGGMGVVFAATHVSLGTPVALKWLPEAGDPTARERLRREARALVALDHPRVVRVLDVELVADAAWLVMERLEGETLRAQLGRLGALGVGETLALARGLAAGLAVLHAAGLVHRDVKPSNVFLVAGDVNNVKIIDLGIARLSEALADETLTATQAVFGSPRYMSPEQLRDAHRVDARADVWSFGVLLYEALAGRTPFAGDNASAITMAIATDEPARLSLLRPDVPRSLEQLVHACLEKRAEDRPPSMDAIRDALTSQARSGQRRPATLPLLACGAAGVVALASVLAAPRTDIAPSGAAPPAASLAAPTDAPASAALSARARNDASVAVEGSRRPALPAETTGASGASRAREPARRPAAGASPLVSVAPASPLVSSHDGRGAPTTDGGDEDIRATTRRR